MSNPFHKIIEIITSHNWFATLYINFKMLPLKKAVYFPIDVYRGIRINSLSGIIVLKSDKLWRGMIKIGGRGSEMFSGNKVVLDIKGFVVFHGQAEIGYGTFVHVSEEAKLVLGNRVRIGAKCKIYCANKIEFGDEIDVSWESQIFDTNFHDIEEVDTGEMIPKSVPIQIGSYNWFGNRCEIMKGTITPDNTIVASNSLTNKNYLSYGNNIMLAGKPAKIVKTGVRRVFEGVNF